VSETRARKVQVYTVIVTTSVESQGTGLRTTLLNVGNSDKNWCFQHGWKT